MQSFSSADVRVVPLESILPHEIADANREAKIRTRLQSDGMLRDPLMVGSLPNVPGFVLLDGTNRRQALLALGFKWTMAQVIQYVDEHAVELRTWGHATAVPMEVIRERAQTLPGITVTALSALSASDALRTTGTLAVLLGRSGMLCLARTHEPDVSRAEQLQSLVAVYESNMVRVDCDAGNVEEQAASLSSGNPPSTLIAFPAFSRSQVVTMATQRALIPAGITRHVIRDGRALRINLPLTALRQAASLVDAEESFRHHVERLQPRYYREPTILYDS